MLGPRRVGWRFYRHALAAMVVAGLCCWVVGSRETGGVGSHPSAGQPALLASRQALPLAFEPNVGLDREHYPYVARGQGYAVGIAGDRAVLGFFATPDGAERRDTRVTLRLVGADPAATVTAAEPQPGYSNYFLGPDPSRWRSRVPHYGEIRVSGAYPGIEVVYHGRRGVLKADYTVAPGADPERIVIRPEGCLRQRLDRRGDLVMEVPGGEVRQPRPVVYQRDGERREAVRASYRLSADGTVRFRLGRYDRTRPLWIDPAVQFATYLGGTNTDYLRGAGFDSSGNFYACGTSNSDNIQTVAPLQATRRGGYDVVLARFDVSLQVATYVTYVGGTGDDTPLSFKVDDSGNAYLAGTTTNAASWPTQAPLNTDGTIFFAKLNSTGSALTFSSLFDTDTANTGTSNRGTLIGMDADSSGNVYLAGTLNHTAFPAANAFQAALSGGSDFWVAKVQSGGSTADYATYLGGTTNDTATAMAVDTSGNCCLIGSTDSVNFPVQNAFQTALRGPSDAVLAVLNPSGAALALSSYLGGTGAEAVGTLPWACRSDGQGGFYFLGSTASSDFTQVGTSLDSSGAQFLARANINTGQLNRATYLGSTALSLFQNGQVYGLALDEAGAVYLHGSGGAVGNTAAVFQQLTAGANGLGYNYSLDGSANDLMLGLAVTRGVFYTVGQTSSSDLPGVTGTSFQASSRGGVEGFAAVIVEPSYQPDQQIRPSATPTFTGDNFYNTDGANQTVTGQTPANSPASYVFLVQNDGNTSDTYTITGQSGATGWTVRYYDAATGGNEITSMVVGGGYTTSSIAAGGTRQLRLEVEPNASVLTGSTQSILITATSTTDSQKRDAVKADTTRVDGPQLVYAGTTGYLADGVEPNTGTIQTSFTFRVKYLNDLGTAASSIRVRVFRDGLETANQAMSVVSGTDPKVGMIYGASNITGLPKGGTYTYRCEGSDGTYTCGGAMTLDQTTLSVVNAAPSASGLNVTPLKPLDTEALTVSYTYADPDGDAESGTTVVWSVNGQPVSLPLGADPKVLTADKTSMGSVVTVVVTPRDGSDSGTPVSGPQRTIESRTLTLSSVGTVGVQGSLITVTATLVDGSAQPAAGETILFQNNGVTLASLLSDANGQAAVNVNLALGTNRVDVSSGGATAVRNLTGRALGTTTMTVTPGTPTADQEHTILVTVADKTTLERIEGMEVRSIQVSGTTISPTSGLAASDVRGEARLTHTFALGAHELRFTAGDATQTVTVTAVAGTVSRNNSVVLMPVTVVAADGVSTVSATIRVRDARGNAVIGIPGSGFLISAVPDLGVSATFSATDQQGAATASIRATKAGDTVLTIKVKDPSNGQFTTLNDALPLHVTPVFTLHLQPGLNLVGSPVVLANPSPATVWRDVNPLRVARYLPQYNGYAVLNALNPGTEFDVTSGRAFWVKTGSQLSVTLSGDPGVPVKLDGGQLSYAYRVSLSGYDWTLATIPTLNALRWDPRTIQVAVGGSTVGSLAEAGEFVASYGWLWDAARQRSVLLIDQALGISGSTDVIPAGSGFWLRRGTASAAGVSAVFDTLLLARSHRQRSLAAATASDWSLSVQAAADGVPGGSVTVGSSRRLAGPVAIEPPPIPAEGEARLELLDGGRALSGLLQPAGGLGGSWRLRCTAPAGARSVTLTWPQANLGLPTGFRALLEDPTTGRTISLLGRSSYEYAAGAQPERELVLRVERRTGERLAVGLQARPNRSRSAVMTVTVNQPATLRVRVLGISGRLVREWTVGAVEAGSVPVGWDGRDSAGRRVPAGTYRIEARVEDETGESAVGTALVTVR